MVAFMDFGLVLCSVFVISQVFTSRSFICISITMPSIDDDRVIKYRLHRHI